MRRNSRNHPFARRAQSRRRGTVAISLTIAIVILEASGMRCPMGVPQPKLSENGWGRRFMDKRLWYLIAGTRGGINRARILWTLHDRPYNANDLATRLALDYKTVRHHLDVLRENDCVMTLGNEGYGTLFLLENLAAMYFYVAMNDSNIGASVAIPMLVLNAAELVGFATLFFVSWR